jgi:hypothetical protein
MTALGVAGHSVVGDRLPGRGVGDVLADARPDPGIVVERSHATSISFVVEPPMKGLSPAVDGSRTRLGPTAVSSGGRRAEEAVVRLQSWISNGTTAMFEATP